MIEGACIHNYVLLSALSMILSTERNEYKLVSTSEPDKATMDEDGVCPYFSIGESDEDDKMRESK